MYARNKWSSAFSLWSGNVIPAMLGVQEQVPLEAMCLARALWPHSTSPLQAEDKKCKIINLPRSYQAPT